MAVISPDHLADMGGAGGGGSNSSKDAVLPSMDERRLVPDVILFSLSMASMIFFWWPGKK